MTRPDATPVVARACRSLGVTEGQLYTLMTSLLLALALLGLGIPSLADLPAPMEAATTVSPQPLPSGPAIAEAFVAPPDQAPAALPPDATTPEPAPAVASASGSGSAAAPASFAAEPAPAPAPDAPPTSAPPPTDLRVREGRYATASGPLVPGGQPGQLLPVALRVGSPDKQSYLRLDGTRATLRLALSAEPAHQVGEVTAVRACSIRTAGWKLADGAPLSSAPAVDAVDCALGRPTAGGWTFELGGVDLTNGVALVPSGPATGTFQITFRPVPP